MSGNDWWNRNVFSCRWKEEAVLDKNQKAKITQNSKSRQKRNQEKLRRVTDARTHCIAVFQSPFKQGLNWGDSGDLRSSTSYMRSLTADVGPPPYNLRRTSFSAIYNETVSGYLSTSSLVVVTVLDFFYNIRRFSWVFFTFCHKHGFIVPLFLCTFACE